MGSFKLMRHLYLQVLLKIKNTTINLSVVYKPSEAWKMLQGKVLPQMERKFTLFLAAPYPIC